MDGYDVYPKGDQMCSRDEAGTETCWAAPGSSGYTMSAATPGTTTIGPDGRARAPSTPPVDPLTQAPVAPPPEAIPVEQTEWYRGGGSGGYRSSGGYSRSYGGGYSGGGSGYGGGGYAPGGDFGGGGPTAPRYADGTTHPFFGGPPRTPGGIFAQQDGYDDRVQVTNPETGASAGPFGVTAPRSADSGSYGYGGGSSGGGGGGGLARSMIGRIRGNVEERLGGMGPGASPDEDAYLRQQQRYKQQGRRIDRAADRYNEQLGEPQHLPVRGWSKRQGYKPGAIDAALGSPGLVASDALGGLDLNSATDPLTDLPMTDLALLMYGAKGRKLTSKTPTVDVPGVLKRQAGYEEIEPDFKRTLDPSKTVNKVAMMFRKLAGGQMELDTESLLGGLAGTRKKSALGQGLAQQAEFDPGGALGQLGQYVHAAYAPLGATGWTSAMHEGIDRELMERGGSLLRKKPQNMARAARQVGNAFLGR